MVGLRWRSTVASRKRRCQDKRVLEPAQCSPQRQAWSIFQLRSMSRFWDWLILRTFSAMLEHASSSWSILTICSSGKNFYGFNIHKLGIIPKKVFNFNIGLSDLNFPGVLIRYPGQFIYLKFDLSAAEFKGSSIVHGIFDRHLTLFVKLCNTSAKCHECMFL